MNGLFKIGLACACLVALLGQIAPAQAFGLGNCYGRIDGGYSWSTDPGVRLRRPLPVRDPPVNNIDLDNAGFVEGGFGCAHSRRLVTTSLKDTMVVETPSGLRGDVVFGFRGNRDLHAEPEAPIITPGPDPIDTDLRTFSVMFNGYYDFHLNGAMGLIPYVGGGIGVARHDFGTVTIVNGGVVRFDGGSDSSFAWQVMAGVGKEVSPGFIVDLGYRYVDQGEAVANDGAGHIVTVNDLDSHEIKLGVRIGFGGGN